MEYTIKQAAALTGASAESLRYYDKEKILSPARKENGYRIYNEENILQLKYLALLKYAQFPLCDIKQIIKALNSKFTPECFEKCKTIIQTGSKKLEAAIQNYREIINLMAILFPMMEKLNSDCNNNSEIDSFVKKLYTKIIKGDL